MAAKVDFDRDSLIGAGEPVRRLPFRRAAIGRSVWGSIGAVACLGLPVAVYQLRQQASGPPSANTDDVLQQSESFLTTGAELCPQATDEGQCDRIGCCTFNKHSSSCQSSVGKSPCHQGSSVEAGAKWILSEEGANCNDACHKEGLLCNEGTLTDTDTESEVISIAQKVGHECASTAGWVYDTNPGVCTNERCCGGDCKGICTYGNSGRSKSCDAADRDYSRFCPCLPKGATWILSREGSSCSDACEKEGATCDEEALKKVDTADEILGVASAAGTKCASQIGATVGWAYSANPGVCTAKSCCGDGSCTGVCAFGKTRNGGCSSKNGPYSRLCPCVGGETGGSTTPPPDEGDPERVSVPSWHWGSGIRGMETRAGFSWYTRIFTLLHEEPLDWQMGTAGSWMQPTNIDFDVCACDPHGWPSNTEGDPSDGCCNGRLRCRWLYQTIEGGPGYWSGSELPTQTMKWRIVITTACYENGGQTPLFFYGGKVVDCNDMGVVQLSNRMLLAPDGIAFSHQGLFGVGWVRTPIGKTSASDDRNFWTFVVDTRAFAGPVAYLLPEMFRERPKKWRVQSAHLKDFGSPGVGMNNGGGFGFEWNTLFSYKQGDFFKIPQMAVPVSGGKSVLAMNGRGYEDIDVYDPLEEALSQKKQLSPENIMAKWKPFGCYEDTHFANFRVSGDKTATLGKLRTEKGLDGCRWTMTTDNSSGYFPQYFRASDMRPVDESVVPRRLQKQKFPKKGFIWPFKGPYDATSKPPVGGCLKSPGPADHALYCAQTSSPSWIAYVWYRFVDQPGLQRLGLSRSEKGFLQSRVETLHKMLNGKDQWIKPGTAMLEDIAELSNAQLVTPPAHMKYGYVPIVVYEGIEKPSGCSEP